MNNINFEIGDVVICTDYDYAVEMIKKVFGEDVEKQDGFEEYLQIIRNIINVPLTVSSYKFGRYIEFEEKDKAPKKWNYTYEMFTLYNDNHQENDIKPIFGTTVYQE